MRFFDPKMPESFWDKVSPEPTSGCWLWTGSLSRKGYAQWRYKGFLTYAHRAALEADGGVPTESTDHLCRQKCCVNPEHLEFVTAKVNSFRARKAPEAKPVKTHCPRGHEYTKDNSLQRPRGTVECRECMRQRWRDWKASK